MVEVNDVLKRVIARSWCEICGYDTVDPDVDFFELGGNSLQAVEVVTQLQPVLGEDVPLLAIFFENPTVSAIAAAILESLTSDELSALGPRLTSAGG